MSTTPTEPTGTVMTPTGQTASVTPMPGSNGQSGGSLLVTAMPLAGGRRRKTLSKKVLKMLKKMGPSKVAKMIKKGGNPEGEPPMGGRRHRGSKKTRRHSRRRA